MARTGTTIKLNTTQFTQLQRLASARNTSEEALLSVAIDRLIEREEEASRLPDEAWARERASMEERMKLGPLPGSRTWTREDLHDR